MFTKMYFVGLLQAALVLSVLAQNEYSKEESQYSGEKATQSSKEGPYLKTEAPTADLYEPSTKKTDDVYPSGEYHSGINRRDLHDRTTLKPSTEPVPITSTGSSFAFNRHRRDSPTLKPGSSSEEHLPTVVVPSSSAKPHSHQRRDLPGFTSEPSPSSSSSSTTERESRFFITREPVDGNGTATTRRSIFNRNRRDSSDEPTTKKHPHFHLGGDDDQEESKEASSTHVPSQEEMTSTTRRFGAGRFRRNSHEFPPEDEEQGAGHTHASTPVPLATTTKKMFHTRAQRALPQEELFEKRTSTEHSTTHNIFHLGHSDEESSSTERQALNPGGRFRRSDDLGSSQQGFLFNRPTTTSTQEPVSTSGTKESSESTTRQFGGFFRN